MEYVHQLRQELGIRIKSFGHAGDGNLHVYILKDDLPEDKWQELLDKAMEGMYAKARELRGQVSGEHGIGLAKRPYLKESLPEASLAIMQGIKQVFDPNNILNPHKVCQA